MNYTFFLSSILQSQISNLNHFPSCLCVFVAKFGFIHSATLCDLCGKSLLLCFGDAQDFFNCGHTGADLVPAVVAQQPQTVLERYLQQLGG